LRAGRKTSNIRGRYSKEGECEPNDRIVRWQGRPCRARHHCPGENCQEKVLDNNPALQHYNVEAVAIDGMFFMAKNVLNKQQDCIRDQLPSNIGMSRRFSLCIYSARKSPLTFLNVAAH
jgi:hypothetical protein